MKLLIGILNIIRVLSLDIAAGGVICTSAVARLYNVAMPWTVSVCLFLAIWCIYTIDHLMDALKIENPTMHRHQFHQKHKVWIEILLILAIVVGGAIAFYLPEATLKLGIGLTVCVGLYFMNLYVSNAFVPKEILVGGGYALGVFLGPISVYQSLPEKWLILLIQFALVAISNLILFSWLEKEKDLEDGSQSWATRYTAKLVQTHFKVLLGTVLVLAAVGLVMYAHDAFFAVFQLIVLAMIGTLEWIRRIPGQLRENENYRLIGDAVFLYPGILLFF